MTLNTFRIRMGGIALLLTGMLTIAPVGPSVADDASLEYVVKAAYLSKFGLFVDWPKSSFASASSAIIVCVVGENPFGNTLDKVVQGQHIGEHPITVRYMKMATRDSGCDILYVGGPDAQSVEDTFTMVSGMGVLTVADAERDDHAAGIVDFVIQDNRVRFNINEQAAMQNGITLSSHLLNLALSVKSKE